MRILVVDDSEVILDAVLRALKAEGHEVIATSNPMLIAAEFRKRPVDLLLLDVEMPALKGPEVVQALRRSSSLRETKVILYSASTDPASLDEIARACGAVGSIPKNTPLDELGRRIERSLRRGDPAAPGSSLGETALVVVHDAITERDITDALTRLSWRASPAASLGVDRSLREGAFDLVVLDPKAFSGPIDPVLARLRQRGLLARAAALVVGGPSAEADGVLDPADLSPTALRRAIALGRAAAAARGASR